MDKKKFEALFKKCYNPSITDFKKVDGESWNEIDPDFAEKCNYVAKDVE